MSKIRQWIKCPQCGKRANKIISIPSGIIFKGVGFPGNDMKKEKISKKEDLEEHVQKIKEEERKTRKEGWMKAADE